MFSLTEDQTQRITSTLSYVTEIFKLVMGCMLVVFVPQRCADNPEHPTDPVCTLRDNFVDLIPYNVYALTWNFITFVCLVTCYTVEYRREKWCIKYLDQDREQSDRQLALEIAYYPAYLQQLIFYNRLYDRMVRISIGLVVINMISSGFLTTYYYYLDYRSVLNLFTNSLLVLEKLYHSYEIAQSSTDELYAVSAYLVVPVIYNTIDDDYRKKGLPQQAHAPFRVYLPSHRLTTLFTRSGVSASSVTSASALQPSASATSASASAHPPKSVTFAPSTKSGSSI